MWRFFAEGGMGMLPTLAFGLLHLATAAAWLLAPRARLLWLCASLGGVTVVSGLLGGVLGAVTTVVAVEGLPAAERFGAKMVGFSQSLDHLTLALVLLVLGSLLVSAGALRAALAAGPERTGP